MDNRRIPLLWLCGPPGVGKSTVAFEVFCRLSRSGIRAAYLDTDQIALCYPSPLEESHPLRARGLSALWPNFWAAGAQCLIVSGNVSTPEEARAYADALPDTAVTLCRLRVGRSELAKRFTDRGWHTERVAEALAEADALDRGAFVDLCADTDGLPVADVARTVCERTGRPGAPRDTGPVAPVPPPATALLPPSPHRCCGSAAPPESASPRSLSRPSHGPSAPESQRPASICSRSAS